MSSTPDNGSVVDYGYAPASPDHVANYGYETMDDLAKNVYGYGGDDHDNDMQAMDYGYGDESESAPSHPVPSTLKAPRRSSLKTSGRPRRASISYKGEIDITLPNKTVVRRRTSITFQEENDVKEVQPVTTMVEPEEFWIMDDEFHMIQEKARLTIDFAKAIKCPEILAKKNICTRGFERYLEDDNDSYCAEDSKYWSKYSVLEEQYHQRQVGDYYCDERLASKYAEESMESHEKARWLAERDYEEIKADHQATRRMMRRCSM